MPDREKAVTAFSKERTFRWEGASLNIPENVDVRMHIPCCTGGDAELTTDLFLPPDEFTDPRPAMLFIHGGGWQGGSPTQFYRQAAMLAEQGVVGSCCRYRFSDDATFPASVHDVKAAVRWLRANADELNVDPDRIGVMGGSAGGHLAGMLATTAGVEELEGGGGNPEQRADVRLAVLLNPITDMTVFASDTTLHPAVAKYLGGPPEEMPAQYVLASPLLNIDADTPPCFLLHGTADTTVPHDQSVRFAEALGQIGQEAELVLIPDVPHGFFNKSPHFEDTWPAMEAFIVKHLGI
ncbi:MAG: alpha/beta hydrolase [Armatimonadota bacterium]